MKRLKLGAVLLALLALAAVALWQQQRSQRLMGELASLHEQLGQAEALRLANQRLSEELKAAAERVREAGERAKANLGELLRLRGRTATVRQIEQENAQLKAERDPLAKEAVQTVRDMQEGTGMSAEEVAEFGKRLPEMLERMDRGTAAMIGLRGLQLLSTGNKEDLEQYLARWVGNYYQAYSTNSDDDGIIARIERAATNNAAIRAAISRRTQ